MNNDPELNHVMELMKPVDSSIRMCDDETDLLILACAMLQRADELFCKILGKEGRTTMFLGVINGRKD